MISYHISNLNDTNVFNTALINLEKPIKELVLALSRFVFHY